MTEVTALSIVQNLETAVGRFQTTGDKSSLKGSFSWAKGAAAKLDAGDQDIEDSPALEEVAEKKEDSRASFFKNVKEEEDED